MIKEKVLIFGSTGQIGKHLIRKLTKNSYKAICQTRNAHKSVFLKTSGSIGYIDIVETSIFDEKKLDQIIKDADICVNLIGILHEKNKFNSFSNIHTKFPALLSMLCKKNNTKFIHLSALGVENATNSLYAKSKLDGEKQIISNYEKAVILKPSVVFSVSDSFTTKFLSLLSIFPIFPLYHKGETKFMPIHATDVANLIYYIISNEIISKKIEVIGPEILTLKEIIEILLISINKKRILIPMPNIIAKISAMFFQKFPNPPITLDQFKLLKYHNVRTKNSITNFSIGCPSVIKFKDGIQKYSYNWREGGQYSVNNLINK